MVKTGIVGMGIRGRLFARTLADNPYAEVTAACDNDEKALELAGRSYRVNTYRQFTEMMDREQLDCLIIALPDFLHRDALLEAAGRKISVLLEKPFATDLKEARQMVEKIKASGMQFMLAFENRWNPNFVSIKRAIPEELGGIQAMNITLNDTIAVPTELLPWLANSSPVWFLQSHMVDMAGWLCGKKVRKVYAVGSKKVLQARGMDTYDTVHSTLTYEDGTNASLFSSWVLPRSKPTIFDVKFEIIGTTGAAYVDLVAPVTSILTDRYSILPGGSSQVAGKPIGAPCSMVNSFIDNIRLGTEPLVSLEEAWENTVILDAIHRSMAGGSIIEL